MQLNGGKIVLKALKDMGTKDIFGYPGGAVIPLYNELYDQMDEFNHYRGAHEKGVVHAADGYARTTGDVGVCFVTSGPGATNTITGIATAYMDSVPLVVISGQVPMSVLGKDSFQEIDITGVTMSITKHNYLVEDINDLERVVKEAYLIASTGRKGPVLIDIPKNIFIESCEYKNYDANIKLLKTIHTNNLSKINQSIQLIKKSKNPVIYAGGGVKHSLGEKTLLTFASRYQIPVVNTLMGLGCFPRDHDLSLGLVGMHGFSEANMAVMESDLIIAIGARFSDRVIGNPKKFAQKANIIHIDLDKTELDKNVYSEVKLCGDATVILNQIMQALPDHLYHEDWIKTINAFRQKDNFNSNVFHPGNVLKKINSTMPENTIVATDVGQHQMWTAQYWQFMKSDSFITSGGLGTMGYGLGAAIGAKVGNPDRPVVLITGDGSFRMNCNELSLLKKYNLPVLIILFNNNTLGMVRQWQKMFQEKRYAETDIEDINYLMLANAYGLESVKVSSLKELNQVMDHYNPSKSLLIECTIDLDENVIPIVPPGEAISQLILN